MRNNPKRETILAALAKGDVVSGAEISASLGVTRAAVWKQINALRAEGYAIPGDPRSGYRLLAEGERAFEASLLRAFGDDGRRVVFYRATGSTNTDLKELAAAGAPAGTVCVAESQSGGRGRRGRSFASPAGGAYFSLLLRPDLALSEVSALTGAVAVAVARVLEEMTGLSVGIKWVNDLWLNNKKAVGILCEAVADLETGTPEYVIVGVGIDLAGELPPELDGVAIQGVHEQSGARLLYLKNDDSNKAFAIGFRTPPADDTGVFHILEHSVLCGSDRFPVKEPFVNLLKTSMQTFLNALTFPDKTMYPVASTNAADLKNLGYES